MTAEGALLKNCQVEGACFAIAMWISMLGQRRSCVGGLLRFAYGYVLRIVSVSNFL